MLCDSSGVTTLPVQCPCSRFCASPVPRIEGATVGYCCSGVSWVLLVRSGRWGGGRSAAHLPAAGSIINGEVGPPLAGVGSCLPGETERRVPCFEICGELRKCQPAASRTARLSLQLALPYSLALHSSFCSASLSHFALSLNTPAAQLSSSVCLRLFSLGSRRLFSS